MAMLNGMPEIETTEFLLSKADDFGTDNFCSGFDSRQLHQVHT
jgi:hypothetical protein